MKDDNHRNLEKRSELSSITIQKTIRNPDGVCLEDKAVTVKNHDMCMAYAVAKTIWKGELK